MALAIVAEGKGACKIAYCRVCLDVFKRSEGRGRPRTCCEACNRDWHLKTCNSCGRMIEPGRRNRFCAGCMPARQKEYQQAYHQEYALKRRALKPVHYASCKECSVRFVMKTSASLFCSTSCQKKNSHRIHSPMRRARKMAAQVEVVNPLKVFDRDGWRCQICHKPTPKRLRGTKNERAPELDHIVPLSRGGEHSYRNTQCACRKCNGSKGTTTYGQLPLLAF